MHGEEIVCEHLKSRRMKVLERNVRAPFAEIDIIAEDGEVLCFIEVRTRKDTSMGHPAETIDSKKIRSIRRAAEAYLVRHRITQRAVRFDVATIVWQTREFSYFENAF